MYPNASLVSMHLESRKIDWVQNTVQAGYYWGVLGFDNHTTLYNINPLQSQAIERKTGEFNWRMSSSSSGVQFRVGGVFNSNRKL
jgi:hypothetical protein